MCVLALCAVYYRQVNGCAFGRRPCFPCLGRKKKRSPTGEPKDYLNSVSLPVVSWVIMMKYVRELLIREERVREERERETERRGDRETERNSVSTVYLMSVPRPVNSL